MDDQTEKKIRDLKLRILKTEKELQSSQHNMKLGAWLRAGHAGQINRNAEKDRLRLEDKLKELKAMLESLTGITAEPPLAKTPAAQPVKSPKTEKADSVKKETPKKAEPAKEKTAAKTEKKTAKKVEKEPVKKAATSKKAAAEKKPAKKTKK